MPNVVFGPIEETDLIQRLINPSIVYTVESRSKSEILSAGHAFVEILIFGNDADERFETSLFKGDVTISDTGAAGAGSQLAA
jgi:hypothetical protein